MQKKINDRALLKERFQFLDQVLHDRLNKNLVTLTGRNGTADRNLENKKLQKPFEPNSFPDLKPDP